MKRTVISHFYNEEWLLPLWLQHHREIFDHGIMINYGSTDRSVEYIKGLCPSWTIVDSKNKDFDAPPVDKEVEEYEQNLTGWRVCLNTTEFMIGNYNRLTDSAGHDRIYLKQYIFVDMESGKEVPVLDPSLPIYHQRKWGYTNDDYSKLQSLGTVARPPRSIHNYHAKYPVVGRHFWSERGTYDDLVIFYYGFGSIEEGSLKRRLQIQNMVPKYIGATGPGSHHKFDRELLLRRFREEQQPLAKNLTEEIQPIINLHNQTKRTA